MGPSFSFSISIVPFVILGVMLLIAGGVLLGIGIRGRRLLDDPHCSRCGYDLRTFGERPVSCPECGSDLAVRGAVRFATRVRSKLKIVAGAAMLFLALVVTPVLVAVVIARPMIVPGALRAGFPPNSPPALAVANDDELIGRISEAGDEPWVWNELETRLAAGSISTDEAANVIDELEELLTSDDSASGSRAVSSGDGTEQFLSMSSTGGSGRSRAQRHQSVVTWADDAIKKLCDSGLLDVEDRRRLALLWTQPTELVVPRRVREGEAILVEQPMDLHSSGPFRRLARIAAVRIDGAEALRSEKRGRFPGSMRHQRFEVAEAPRGTHELEVDVEWVVLEAANSVPMPMGEEASSAFEKVEAIPDPPGTEGRRVAHGIDTVKATVSVVGDGESLRETFVDPARRGELPGAFPVKQAVVLRKRDGSGVSIQIDFNDSPPDGIPLIVRPVVEIGGTRLVGDTMATIRIGSSSSSVNNLRIRGDLPALGPDVTSVDVTFEPDPDWSASLGPEYDRVWGEPILLKGVKLDRRDLEGRAAGP